LIAKSNVFQIGFISYMQFLTGMVLVERNTLPDDLETNSCATFCQRLTYYIQKRFPIS